MARKRQVKQFQLTSEIVQSYLDCSSDAMALFDTNGNIIYCNPAHTDVFGYNPDELIGLHFTELKFLHRDSILEFREIFKAVFSDKQLEVKETQITRKDGKKAWIETSITPLMLQGNPAGIQTLSRTITERKKTEENTRLHLMFEKIVANISSRFLSIPDSQIDKEIENTLKEVCSFIGAIRGDIYLLDDDKKELTISHEWCDSGIPCQKEFVQGMPVHGWKFIKGKLSRLEDVIIDSLVDLPKDSRTERQWYDEHGFLPVFIIPIVSESEISGAMGFYSQPDKHHHWPKHYAYLLRYIGTLFYSAIKRKEISRNMRLTRFSVDHNSQSVFWMRLSDLKIIDVNPAACKALGYARKELLTLSVFDFVPAFLEEEAAGEWKELQDNGSQLKESRHRRKDGSEFPVEVFASLIEFEDQQYIVAFARDITDRIKAQAKIKKTEREYKKIFENVVDVFYEASLDGILINVTPSVERLTNFRQEDLLGKPMEVFYYDPSAREPLLKLMYEKGEVFEYEILVKDLDGSPIPCSLNAKLIRDEEEKPERIVGSIADLRQRKKDEKQIRQLSTALEQSPVAVAIMDKETRIQYINNNFTTITGMKPETILGFTPVEVAKGRMPTERYKRVWDKVREGNLWKGEIQMTKPDGSRVWMAITVSPVYDNKQNIINYVNIMEEVTERKQYEQNLKEAKEYAEKSDHLKSAFLANMSHEIRTPMNAILGFSSLLREENLKKEKIDYYLDIINSKGRDLLRIISDIIDISRIEAGDLIIKLEPVHAYPFLLEIYNEFREDPQVRSRSHFQFRLNVPDPGKKIIVNTDRSRLKQIFTNLIQNALKFTHDGFVEFGFELQDENSIRFYTRDSGIGIPEEKKQIIFERFRQIDESHTRKYGGTGLGLAICKNLLELMGSELMLETAVGQGSEFMFSMKYISTENPEKPDQKENKTEPVKLNLKGKRILIVEDDSSSYMFLETLISKYSAELIWAKNGRQAIEIVDNGDRPDLVLMDIRMPEMDGFDVTRIIKKKNKKIPIIAQTAYAQVSDRKLALESGCDDYLSKPVSPVELRAILHKYLIPQQ